LKKIEKMKGETPKLYPIVLSGIRGAVLRCLVTDQGIILYYPYKLLEKDRIRNTIPYYDVDSLSFEKYHDKLHVVLGLIALGMGIFCVTFILPLLLTDNFINPIFITSVCWIFFIFCVIAFPVKVYQYKKGAYTILIKTYKQDYRFSGKPAELKELCDELLNHIPNIFIN